MKTVTVEDGEIAFTLDEGGDYFIARRALAGSLNDPGHGRGAAGNCRGNRRVWDAYTLG